ncbi:MAG: hypothetical protein C5B50_07840 [Verrucomicrobia bacterium]|nr:MAG: hypothetical protein C5B50_07840 [Verrucomicrobiota bacterium]
MATQSKDELADLDRFAPLLVRWLRQDKLSPDECLAKLQTEHELTVSRQSLLDWRFKRFNEPLEEKCLLAFEHAALNCDLVKIVAGQDPGPELARIMAVHRVTALKLAIQAAANSSCLKLAEQITAMTLDFAKLEEKQKMDERKLTLLEDKAKQADDARTVLEDHRLTEAERANRMKELFGVL